MPEKETIIIKGAREHNLKNIDIEIPRNKLVVITGISGSGKSSLAFDTIYAEGQRRYVESLSAYARQFLGLMEKPDLDYIEGLSPAISIEQRTASKNPRSTVGTVTEIYDYLRLLFARIGVPYCYNCGKKIQRQNVQQIVDFIMTLSNDTKIQVLAPLVRGRKGEYREVFEEAKKDGYVRVRVDGEIRELETEIKLDKYKKHNIEVVVDRLVIESKITSRLTESVETAIELASGYVLIDVIDGDEMFFSEHFACIDCGISYEELAPRMFSFNSPYGACPDCKGLGTTMEVDPDLVVPNKNLSINGGAIKPWGEAREGWYFSQLLSVANNYKFDLNIPYKNLSPEHQKIILYGSGEEEVRIFYANENRKAQIEYNTRYEGVINNLKRRYHQTSSSYIRSWIEQFMNVKTCTTCGGSRLRKESLAVRIGNFNIHQVSRLSVKAAENLFNTINLKQKETLISHQIFKEIKERLKFLINVGVDYLTLDRSTSSLSGGEAQRIRLATQIGSQLVGVLYILDEPSIGLHQRDNQRLIDTLLTLRNLGNTVIVVEHDRDTILNADFIVDLGPGAGIGGGEVVAIGDIETIKNTPQSITGDYLTGRRRIKTPAKRRNGNSYYLTLYGAVGNNLKYIDVKIPL